jgi:hypothetical protein
MHRIPPALSPRFEPWNFSLFEHIHPEAAHFLIGPSLRAISDVPGFTLEEKNARAAAAWAVMTNVDPCDGYSLMLYGHAFVLNDLCSDAGHDALTEARSGMMPGTESPMKWRAMSAYGTMHRALCQNVNAFLRVRKELTPAPPVPPGARKRTAKQPATEPPTGPMAPAEHAPPGAEGDSVTGPDAMAATTHPAAASFVATSGAADGERSDSEIVTQRKQNTAPEPAIARHAPDAASESRACAWMPAGDTARASLAPVAVPPTVTPLAPPIAPPIAPLAAGTTPAAAGFARSHEAGTTPCRIRDGPRTNFSRRRSALSVGPESSYRKMRENRRPMVFPPEHRSRASA